MSDATAVAAVAVQDAVAVPPPAVDTSPQSPTSHNGIESPTVASMDLAEARAHTIASPGDCLAAEEIADLNLDLNLDHDETVDEDDFEDASEDDTTDAA